MHDYDNLLYKIARKLAYFEIYGEFLVEDERNNKPHATSIWGSDRDGSCFPLQQHVLQSDYVRYENSASTELPNATVRSFQVFRCQHHA
uniref:Uncharacterized protein n=1 Tax=Romanomermis culicivorax TaxID=13658 RepID=A0A915J7W5_ROMCU